MSNLVNVTTWSAKKLHRVLIDAERTLCNEKAVRPTEGTAKHGYGVFEPTNLSQSEIDSYPPCKRCEKAAEKLHVFIDSPEGLEALPVGARIDDSGLTASKTQDGAWLYPDGQHWEPQHFPVRRIS